MHLSKLVVTSLLLVGCGTTIQATPINPAPRPMTPRPPETVEMFTTSRPTRPYVDVALLEAEQSSGYSSHDTPEMFAALRERGARMGCDAIVLNGMSARSTGDTGVESLVSDDPPDRKGIYATCVMYTSPADGQLTTAHQQQEADQKCQARKQETLALANRTANQQARANILASVPHCPGDVVAR